jgi:uncharacterized protein (DUF58 family)
MLIPRTPLIAIAALPIGLSALQLVDSRALPAVLVLDAAILALALFDALLGWRQHVTAEAEAPDVLSLGRDNLVRCRLRSTSRRRLDVRVTQDLFDGATSPDLPVSVRVPARGSATVRFHVAPKKRGAYVLGHVFVRYPTPLGLFDRQAKLGRPSRVRVYPDLQSLRTYDLLARQDREHGLFRTSHRKGGESEFERLREYTNDDEYRSIDWRATARNQKLIVRQYQLESDQSLVFALDAGRLMTATSDGTALFDYALNASLMLAHVAVRRGDRVGLLGFDDQVRAFVPPAAGRAAQRRLIQASYALEPALVEPDYDAAFRLLSTRVRKRSLVVLFTQIADEGAAGAILSRTRQLLPTHLPLVVVLRDEELEGLATGPAASTAELYVKAASAEELRRRDLFGRALTRAGVLLLSTRPKDLTAKVVNRYLEIKARSLL